jgi:ParB-like chromosome segregation protein Spo0J
MKTYEYHPLANVFPLIDGKPYEDLMADILKNGVREAIWLYEGKILDGRNRYRAAKAMKVEAEFRDYLGDDAMAFVISLNIHRRHLSESQRAMAAAKFVNMLTEQRKVDPHICGSRITQADASLLLR